MAHQNRLIRERSLISTRIDLVEQMFPHTIQVPYREVEDAQELLTKGIAPGDWYYAGVGRIYFRNAADAVWFKMMFLSKS
jgi:hypothetical protein